MTDTLIQRLSDEADLCRNDGATDVAKLLDDAVYALVNQAARLAAAEIVSAQPAAPAAAAPSVAPEPVAWTLQSELDAAQTTCSAHLWFTNPRNSAWTALFTREQIAAHPPRAPLTEEHVYAVVRSVQPHLATTSKAWRELAEDCRYWLKAERAVTEAAHGIRGQG